MCKNYKLNIDKIEYNANVPQYITLMFQRYQYQLQKSIPQ